MLQYKSQYALFLNDDATENASTRFVTCSKVAMATLPPALSELVEACAAASSPHGLVLVCGPNRSGKTLLLSALQSHLDLKRFEEASLTRPDDEAIVSHPGFQTPSNALASLGCAALNSVPVWLRPARTLSVRASCCSSRVQYSSACSLLTLFDTLSFCRAARKPVSNWRSAFSAPVSCLTTPSTGCSRKRRGSSPSPCVTRMRGRISLVLRRGGSCRSADSQTCSSRAATRLSLPRCSRTC